MKEYPVLILDDDNAILMALQDTLQLEGYPCIGTTNAAEALNYATQKTFAVVISDQRMADMKGTEFLYKLKQQCPETVRILITGVLTTEMFLISINKAEVFRFLPKPWKREELIQIVHDAYERFEFLAAYPKAHESLLKINQQIVEENLKLRKNFIQNESRDININCRR